jgi:hypothetical protein
MWVVLDPRPQEYEAGWHYWTAMLVMLVLQIKCFVKGNHSCQRFLCLRVCLVACGAASRHAAVARSAEHNLWVTDHRRTTGLVYSSCVQFHILGCSRLIFMFVARGYPAVLSAAPTICGQNGGKDGKCLVEDHFWRIVEISWRTGGKPQNVWIRLANYLAENATRQLLGKIGGLTATVTCWVLRNQWFRAALFKLFSSGDHFY